jgi:hypothetical protein
MPTSTDTILAYQASDFVEAHSLAVHLGEEGIDARVLGEALQGAYAGIALGGMDRPEVWIAGADRAAAEPLIAAWRAEQQARTAEASPISGNSAGFRFSMMTLFGVMTLVALWAGAYAMRNDTFTIVLDIALMMCFPIILYTCRRR